jgi:hypothetical protein
MRGSLSIKRFFSSLGEEPDEFWRIFPEAYLSGASFSLAFHNSR